MEMINRISRILVQWPWRPGMTLYGREKCYVFHKSFHLYDNPVIISTLKTRKLWQRELKCFSKGHADVNVVARCKWWSHLFMMPVCGPWFTLYAVKLVLWPWVSPPQSEHRTPLGSSVTLGWGWGLGWGTQGSLALSSPPPTFFPGLARMGSEPLSVLNISISVITHYQHQVSLGQSAYWNPPEAHLSSIPHQRDPSSPETSPFLSVWDGINLPKDLVQPLRTNHNWLHIECPRALFYFPPNLVAVALGTNSTSCLETALCQWAHPGPHV